LRVPEEQISLEELTVKEDLTYEEFPVKILETAKKSRGVELSKCVRFSGIGTLRVRPPRKERRI
jgi:hypothetical protein